MVTKRVRRTKTKDNQEKDKEYYLKGVKTVKMVISPAAEKVMGESDSYTESAEIKESWKKIGCRRTEVQTPNTGQCKRKSSKMVARI